MAEEKIINVSNRNNGTTSYFIPELNVRRRFLAGETKKVPLSEIKQLSFIDGGDFMIRNLLIIDDSEALDELNIEPEPEYFYTEADIKKVLLEGSVDQLEDMLNFGPDGVKELAKQLAVDLEIPDTRKRKMISEMTGFNVDNAINVRHVVAEDTEEEVAEPAVKTRKAAPIKKEAGQSAPVRKSKYNVISEG